MRDEYRRVYDDLYKSYRGPWLSLYIDFPHNLFPDRQYPAFIAESIDASIQQLDLADRVRPDAKYLLLINFYQMIVLPILFARRLDKASEYNAESLRPDIQSDIQTILKSASVREIQRNGDVVKEISGGRILSEIAALWDELRVARVEVWSKT